MGPWETAPEEVVEEEIDIFAELGALRPNAPAPQPQLHQQMPSQNQSADPLAMFMDDDDDQPLLAGQSAQPLQSQMEVISTTAISQQDDSGKPNFASPVSNEVISELLEILVKKELHSRHARGEDWLSDLPADAVAKIESAKVVKDQEAYHLSLIIDMVGTGQVRPFATVLSTEQVFSTSTSIRRRSSLTAVSRTTRMSAWVDSQPSFRIRWFEVTVFA